MTNKIMTEEMVKRPIMPELTIPLKQILQNCIHVMWSKEMSLDLQIILSFVFYCFAKPSTACISGTNQPIFIEFSATY